MLNLKLRWLESPQLLPLLIRNKRLLKLEREIQRTRPKKPKQRQRRRRKKKLKPKLLRIKFLLKN